MKSIWEKARHGIILNRLNEEKLYERVLHEMEIGARRDGLWAKALHKSRGNADKAKAKYIEYRVQALKDEAAINTAAAVNVDANVDLRVVHEIDAYDEDGYTPLMVAVKRNDAESVRSLLERGANPAIKDEGFGTSTALRMARLQLMGAHNQNDAHALREIVAMLEPVTDEVSG